MTADAGPPRAFAPTQPPAAPAVAKPVPLARPDDTRIAEAIGRQLALPLDEMQGIVQDFMRSGRISRAQIQQLAAAIEDAKAIALQCRQLARLADPGSRRPPQRLRLDILVSQALAAHMPLFQRNGIALHQQVAPAHIAMDDELLSTLVEAAIASCTHPTHRLDVVLTPPADRSPGVLYFHAQPLPAPAAQSSPRDVGVDKQLSWHLLDAIACQTGVRIQRRAAGDDTSVTIVFAGATSETAHQHEADTGEDSWLHSEAAAFMGHRVLLVSSHAALREQTQRICATMGIVLDTALSCAQAQAHIERHWPDLLLFDTREDGAEAPRLQQTLRADEAGFPWIDIGSGGKPPSLEGWINAGNDNLTLDNLRSALPAALLAGLSRARTR